SPSRSVSLYFYSLWLRHKREPGRSSVVGIEFFGGVVFLALFIWWERRARFPLLDLKLFRIPAFTLGNAARWISFVTMSINVLLMPFFIQLGMNAVPLQAGFFWAPTPLARGFSAPFPA